MYVLSGAISHAEAFSRFRNTVGFNTNVTNSGFLTTNTSFTRSKIIWFEI